MSMYIGGNPVQVIQDGVTKTLFSNTDDFNAFKDSVESLEESVENLENKAAIVLNTDKWSDIYSVLSALENLVTYPVTIMPDSIKLITNNAITGSCKGFVCKISENAYDFMLMVGNSEAKLFRLSNITESGTGTLSTIRNVTTTAQS